MAARVGLGGNMHFQVQEAEKKMESHLRRMKSMLPNKEIRDSKIPVIRFSKQSGKQRLLLIEREKQNRQLMERLFAIMNEDRERGSIEYAPGLRMNHARKPIIDCYPTTLHVCKNFAKLHSHRHTQDRVNKRIAKENEKFQRHLETVQSPYNGEHYLRDYKRMQDLILQNKIPHTALHLLKASHPNSPPPRARSASPKSNRTRKELDRPDWNFDSKIDPRRRPKSAFITGGEYKAIPEPPIHSIPDSTIHPNAYINFNANHDISFPPALKNILGKTKQRPKSAHASAAVCTATTPRDKTGSTSDTTSQARPVSDECGGIISTTRPVSAPSKNREYSTDPEKVSRSVRERFKEALALSKAADEAMTDRQPGQMSSVVSSHTKLARPATPKRKEVITKSKIVEDYPVVDSVLKALRERYPPRKLVMQSTTVIPRIKFSQKAAAAATDSSPSKPSGRPRVGYFDIRVIEVGVTCPLSDLPEPPTTPRKIQVGNVATTTGILVEAECRSVASSSCQLFLPMKQLKNMCAFCNKQNLLKVLQMVPTCDKQAGLYACLGEYLSAADEDALANVVLSSVEVIFDPTTERSVLAIVASQLPKR